MYEITIKKGKIDGYMEVILLASSVTNWSQSHLRKHKQTSSSHS